MDWFLPELIQAHRIFKHFTSTCFHEIHKILNFAWIYFREYQEIIKNDQRLD